MAATSVPGHKSALAFGFLSGGEGQKDVPVVAMLGRVGSCAPLALWRRLGGLWQEPADACRVLLSNTANCDGSSLQCASTPAREPATGGGDVSLVPPVRGPPLRHRRLPHPGHEVAWCPENHQCVLPLPLSPQLCRIQIQKLIGHPP